MNKFFATIALAALAFTSCIKENSTYKDMLPVQPGRQIYQLTMNQNTLALRPANAGLRLAMLLAEAAKQNPDKDLATIELDKIKSGNVLVQNNLFGSLTKIVREGENYLITFSENAQTPDGFYMKGAVLVRTNGQELLSDATYNKPWMVEMQDLKVIVYSDYGTEQTFNMESGLTSIFANDNGNYTVDVSAFRANIDELESYSNWSGSFDLKAEDSSLAYSLCSGKDFAIEGEASGPTLYSSAQASSVQMSYELTNGVYRGMQILSGTQVCSFTSFFEYDTTQYPSPTVTFEWTFDKTANKIFNKIFYNGYVYPKD